MSTKQDVPVSEREKATKVNLRDGEQMREKSSAFKRRRLVRQQATLVDETELAANIDKTSDADVSLVSASSQNEVQSNQGFRKANSPLRNQSLDVRNLRVTYY